MGARRLTCVAVLLFAALASPLWAQTGYDIMKRANEKPSGNDMSAKVTMRIVSKTGAVKTREFSMLSLKARDGSESVLVKFLTPADVRGTAFLTVGAAGGEKSQYIYLPSLKKTTRIAAQDKSKSFMGSDLTYDDFGTRTLEDYGFTLLGEESLEGKACWKIESKSVDKTAATSRIVSWVEKESLLVLQADFYDKADKLYKQMKVSSREKISGIWTMKELEMKNLATGGSTSLVFGEVKYDSGLSPSLFSKDSLGG